MMTILLKGEGEASCSLAPFMRAFTAHPTGQQCAHDWQQVSPSAFAREALEPLRHARRVSRVACCMLHVALTCS